MLNLITIFGKGAPDPRAGDVEIPNWQHSPPLDFSLDHTFSVYYCTQQI